MEGKPLVLASNDHVSLMNKDLSNVYRHFRRNVPSAEDQLKFEVKFKKKEDIDGLGKSLLKHRIKLLTGKDMSSIESEMGKTLEIVEDMRRFTKLLLHEAFGKLAKLPDNDEIMETTSIKSRKRNFDETIDQEEIVEPVKKKGRKSMAVASNSSPMITSNNRGGRPNRRSMIPELMNSNITTVEKEEEFEDAEENIDDLGLGPNPTPQMIAMKRKSLSVTRKPSPMKKLNATLPVLATPPPKVLTNGKKFETQVMKKKIVEEPALAYFPGMNNSKILFVESDISSGNFGPKDFLKIPQTHLNSNEFHGVDFTFLHTPIEWTPKELFKTVQSIKTMNKNVGLDSFLVMVGCGVSNVHMFREAFTTFTKQVQLIIFEKKDMNLESESNEAMLRETTIMFLLGYFYPGCEDENRLPPTRMVRMELTTCFSAKNTEDLENSIIHAFTEENDWIFDLCCGSRELSLAAQKSGRNAVAFDKDRTKLEEIASKAIAISQHHEMKFRPDVDGKIWVA